MLAVRGPIRLLSLDAPGVTTLRTVENAVVLNRVVVNGATGRARGARWE
jgi:hypothetical protein